jgi:hypothetical protein
MFVLSKFRSNLLALMLFIPALKFISSCSNFIISSADSIYANFNLNLWQQSHIVPLILSLNTGISISLFVSVSASFFNTSCMILGTL